MDVWVEAWTLPESGTFEHIATVPGVIKVRDPHSGIGRGEVVVPASWSGVDSLLSASAGSLLRVLGRNSSNARVVLFEFTPEGAIKEYAEHTTWRFQGPSIEAKLDQAIVLPFDYPTNPSVDPDWVYGFENLLTDGNSGFEINPHSLENADAEDGSTYGWPTTGTRFDAIAPEQFEAKTGAGADTGDWYFEVTADAGEGIYQDFNPQLIDAATLSAMGSISLTYTVTARLYVATGHTVRMEVTDATSVSVGALFNGAAYADAVGNDAYQTVTVTFQAGTGNGGISFLSQTAANTFRIDNVTLGGFGVGTDGWSVRGDTEVFQVSDTFVHEGLWALAWKPGSGVLGGDSLYIPVQTTVGQQVTASIWVYHTEGVTENFRLLLRIPGVNPNTQNVASTVKAVPTATWTQITASGVTTTAVTEIELRYDETGVPANTFYVDDVEFFTGTAPETLGAILGDLLTDVQTTHAAETADFDIAQLTWLKKDFSDSVDSAGAAWDQNLSISIPALLTFGQVMDRMARLGYEYRIVPNPLFPATDTESHLLQVYNPWNPATFAGGAGTNKSATVKITSGQGVLAGPVKRAEQSRTVALAMDDAGALAVSRDSAGEAVWGQRVAGAREQHVFDSSLQELADQVMTDRAQPVTASQVEILAGQFTPYLHFAPGDTITFGLPPDLVDAEHRVAMLTYDVIGHDVVWRVDFDRAVYTGLAGTVQAVGQLLRRAGDPKIASSKVALAATGGSAFGPIETTILVAASNARPALRAQADYRCSGTNDQVEIAAAIAAASSGGTIQLTEGTFNINVDGTAIALTAHSLVGAGWDTVLEIAGTGTGTNVGISVGSDCTISDLTIDMGNTTQDTTSGVRASSLRASVHHVKFTGMDTDINTQTYLSIGGAGTRVSDCYFAAGTGTGTGTGCRAIYLNGNETVITGNIVRVGSTVLTMEIANGERDAITGNILWGGGIDVHDGILTISGNFIWLNGDNTHIDLSNLADDVVISGNYIYGSGTGCRIQLSGTDLHRVLISGNKIRNADVYVLDGAEIEGLAIIGNFFYASGIYKGAGASGVTMFRTTIASNYFGEASGGKIQLGGSTGSSQIGGTAIVGNVVEFNGTESGAMISIESPAWTQNVKEMSWKVAENRLHGTSTTANHWGVYLSATTASNLNMTVNDNHFAGSFGAYAAGGHMVAVSGNVLPNPSSTFYAGRTANQVVVDAVEYAYVENNQVHLGSKGDMAGTGAIMSVTAGAGGRVSDNTLVGHISSTAMDTALAITGPNMVISGNAYLGVGAGWASTQTPLTNGIVVVNTTGAGVSWLHQNFANVDMSGSTWQYASAAFTVTS